VQKWPVRHDPSQRRARLPSARSRALRAPGGSCRRAAGRHQGRTRPTTRRGRDGRCRLVSNHVRQMLSKAGHAGPIPLFRLALPPLPPSLSGPWQLWNPSRKSFSTRKTTRRKAAGQCAFEVRSSTENRDRRATVVCTSASHGRLCIQIVGGNRPIQPAPMMGARHDFMALLEAILCEGCPQIQRIRGFCPASALGAGIRFAGSTCQAGGFMLLMMRKSFSGQSPVWLVGTIHKLLMEKRFFSRKSGRGVAGERRS
jgi:hypothetical protein